TGPALYDRLNRVPSLSRLLNRAPSTPVAGRQEESPAARVVIVGAGRVGRTVSDALRAMAVTHLVVDYDGTAGQRLRAVGVPVLYGDATSEIVLRHAHPEKAELAVVALPEAAMTQMAVRLLKRLAPELAVVARVHRSADIAPIRAAGAAAVIHAE